MMEDIDDPSITNDSWESGVPPQHAYCQVVVGSKGCSPVCLGYLDHRSGRLVVLLTDSNLLGVSNKDFVIRLQLVTR